ncbi:MAG: hypothetical protein EWV80_16955 [Microcystis aeruginosa Ma_QC_B_20070730_S2]|uniref:Uncharacterized protein n=1 Tax=Microcystis aeruginosa Ma_QC_B_20070730_S2 TaxID=2486256 RepID=A0A552DFI4_MICAE|nr:MAG: hypothetical protein EWV80_16955 [Microcystis aeruginosa Ma_QC_B_20070730_S2]
MVLLGMFLAIYLKISGTFQLSVISYQLSGVRSQESGVRSQEIAFIYSPISPAKKRALSDQNMKNELRHNESLTVKAFSSLL